MEHLAHLADALFRRGRARRLVTWLSVAAATAAVGLASAPVAASTPTPSPPPPPPPSAIGSANAIWIQVSPAYRTTGLVIAVASDTSGCSGSGCTHLWVSHDGGASWSKAAATAWNGGRPVIGVDGHGHETLFAVGNSGTQRSDDAGQTWKEATASGGYMPQVEPTYSQDGAVAIGGQHDFVLKGTASSPVSGSGGAASADYQFFFAPGYPSTGSNSPVLLSALTSQNKPIILKCTTALACTGGATLANEQVNQTASIASLAFSGLYASDGVVFAQANRDIYKSSDGGTTFVPLSIAPPDGSTVSTTPMMAVAPGFQATGSVRTLYAAVFEIFIDNKNPRTAGNVYESDDAGSSWHPIATGTPLGSGADAVAVAPDGRIFASYLQTGGGTGSAGLLCSTDGHTWQPSCPAVGAAAKAHSSAGSSTSGHQSGSGSSAPANSAAGSGQSPAAGTGQQGGTQGPQIGGLPLIAAHGPSSMGWRTITAIVALIAVVVLGAASLALRWRERRSRRPTETGEGSL